MPLTIDEIRNIGDPQRSYKWEVLLPGIIPESENQLGNVGSRDLLSIKSALKSVVTGNLTIGTLSGLANKRVSTTNPSLVVKEVNGVPFRSIESEAFYEFGSNTYLPGLQDIERISITFYLNETDSIHRYLKNWNDLIINKQGLKNLPGVYKRTMLIRLLNGRNIPVLAYRLLGCFPTKISPHVLGNASTPLDLTQEFSVDSAEYVDISTQETIGGIRLNRLPPELQGSLGFLTQNSLVNKHNPLGKEGLPKNTLSLKSIGDTAAKWKK